MSKLRRRTAFAIADLLSIALIFVVLIITFDAGTRIWRDWTPASYWFEPNQLVVSDATMTLPPILYLERTIHRSFKGDRLVEMQREVMGRYYTICSGTVTGSFGEDAAYPEPLTLDWIMGKSAWSHCLILPGTYRLIVTWTINAARYGPKYTGIISNDFEVGRGL